MHASAVLFLLSSLEVARALSFSDAAQYTRDLSLPSFSNIKRGLVNTFTRRQGCPAVWSEIHSELAAAYVTNGQCNDKARGVIRLAFHDCFPGAGCDGSIILAGECSRTENNGLADSCSEIGTLATQKGVGVADLIQFAAAIAVVACPLGPQMPAYIGRTDSSVAAPEGELPQPSDSAATLIASFASRGFSANDLVALVGAHSTSRQFFVDPTKAGASQDTTPGTWDVTFYGETLTGTAPFTFQSDKNLATDPTTSGEWVNFSVNQPGWNAAFVSAMTKMALLGVDGGAASLTDCTSVLTSGTRVRDVKGARMMDRAV